MIQRPQIRLPGCLLMVAMVALPTLAGCGRAVPNDPAASTEAADKIRMTLVSAKSAAPTAGATETQAAKATGWGSVKGRFVYEGTAPMPAKLSITKNEDVCGKPPPLIDESLLVSKDGGLKNVVLFLRKGSNEVHPDYDAAKGKTVVIDNQHCRFDPHVLSYRIGQPLELKNTDPEPVGHNINAAFVANDPFNVIVPAGSNSSRAPLEKAEPTPVTLSCNIHPWMKGYLVVQPHPYVAITAEDGTFELKNVPAGVPLEFQAWHEAANNNTGGVGVNRPDLKWQPNGRFTITLEPNQT